MNIETEQTRSPRSVRKCFILLFWSNNFFCEISGVSLKVLGCKMEGDLVPRALSPSYHNAAAAVHRIRGNKFHRPCERTCG